jgi:hypothetical protein
VAEVRRWQGTFVVVIVVVDLVARRSAAVADGDILVCLESVFRKEWCNAVVEEAFECEEECLPAMGNSKRQPKERRYFVTRRTWKRGCREDQLP